MIQTNNWLDIIEIFNTQEYEDWFKFAMIWFYFNNYFNKRYSHVNGEKNKIIEFAKDNNSYYSNSFFNQSILDDFKTKDSDGNKTYVVNMQNTTQKAYFDVEHKSCEDFFKVLYQIRCNFFHGDKQPSNQYDKELVKWAAKILLLFLKGVSLDD